MALSGNASFPEKRSRTLLSERFDGIINALRPDKIVLYILSGFETNSRISQMATCV